MHEGYLNCRRHFRCKICIRWSKDLCKSNFEGNKIENYFNFLPIFGNNLKMTGLKARCEKLRNFNWLNVIALSRTETDAAGEDAEHARPQK